MPLSDVKRPTEWPKMLQTLMIQAVRDMEKADSSSFVAIEQRDLADSTARIATSESRRGIC